MERIKSNLAYYMLDLQENPFNLFFKILHKKLNKMLKIITKKDKSRFIDKKKRNKIGQDSRIEYQMLTE